MNRDTSRAATLLVLAVVFAFGASPAFGQSRANRERVLQAQHDLDKQSIERLKARVDELEREIARLLKENATLRNSAPEDRKPIASAPPPQTPLLPEPASLGITETAAVDAELSLLAPKPPRRGVVVRELVLGGPASKAGVNLGDVILSIGKHKVDTKEQVAEALRATKTGTTVTLVIMRTTDGKRWARRSLRVTSITSESAQSAASQNGTTAPVTLIRTCVIRVRPGFKQFILSVSNPFPQTVVAIEFKTESLDPFGNVVDGSINPSSGNYGSSGNYVWKTGIRPGKTGEEQHRYVYSDSATNLVLTLVRVRFEDGTTWEAKDTGKPVTISGPIAP